MRKIKNFLVLVLDTLAEFRPLVLIGIVLVILWAFGKCVNGQEQGSVGRVSEWKIEGELATNWISLYEKREICPAPSSCLVYHFSTIHQVGNIVSNTYAVIHWKGRDIRAHLEQTPLPGIVERDIVGTNIWLHGNIRTN